MTHCSSCGAALPDGANVCPYCAAVQQTANTYQQIPNTPHDTDFQQAPFSARPEPSQEAQQFYFQQKLAEAINDASTARALGIISIICAIITSFVVICWICGGIGFAKANSAMRFAEQTGNPMLYESARSAKSLNKTGLILSAVIFIVAGFLMLLFAISLGAANL